MISLLQHAARRQPYAFEGHAWKTDRPFAKLTGRAICINCGLLRLRNALTDWCASKGCNYDDHPGYAAALRALPEQHRRAQP